MWYINHLLFGAIIGLISGALLNAERANKYKKKYEQADKIKNWYKDKCEELNRALLNEIKGGANND